MMEIIIGIHRENASFLGLTSVEHPSNDVNTWFLLACRHFTSKNTITEQMAAGHPVVTILCNLYQDLLWQYRVVVFNTTSRSEILLCLLKMQKLWHID